MPALGESVTEGTVTRWLKHEGDTVEVDEPLLEVSTDKVDTEIPSPSPGIVQQILVGEDETVAGRRRLVVVGGGRQAPRRRRPQRRAAQRRSAGTSAAADAAGRAAPAPGTAGRPAAEQAAAHAARAQPAAQAAAHPRAAVRAGRRPRARAAATAADAATYVTPLVRKLAAEHGVDLSSDHRAPASAAGSASRTCSTPPKAAQAAQQAPQRRQRRRHAPAASAARRRRSGRRRRGLRGTTEKMSRLRKVIAQRMVESLQVSAQLTTVVEVDVTKIARLRDRAKSDFEAREGVKLSFLPFFALAAVEALKVYPVVNASFDGRRDHLPRRGEPRHRRRHRARPARAGHQGRRRPQHRRARPQDRRPGRPHPEQQDQLRTSSAAARSRSPTPAAAARCSTPRSSTSRRSASWAPAPSSSGRWWSTDADGGETIAVRSMVYLAMSYDHRIVDGADAARFLVAVKQRLEEGEFEADLGV